MRPTVLQYAQALEALAVDASPRQVTETVQNFAAMLSRRRERKKLSLVLKCLEALEARRAGRSVVHVTTGRPADRVTKETLAAEAERLFPGKRVEPQFHTDHRMIGGVRLQTDEMLYDASVVSFFRKMKKSLVQ